MDQILKMLKHSNSYNENIRGSGKVADWIPMIKRAMRTNAELSNH